MLPHQVGAAGRILSDRMPRFVLADEVGLGKTVEAGLVFAGLRQLGIAERVLVVVPEHLAFQWLAELFHKFNALFTLLTPERIAELGGPEAALARSPHAIVSFEALRGDEELAAAAAAAPLDLVVVDEAHHLADDALHDAVAPICRASFGVLLLTATPVRLDPREYFRLLALVEPVPSTSEEEFLARLEQHEAYAEVARALLAGAPVAEALERLREALPGRRVLLARGAAAAPARAPRAPRRSLQPLGAPRPQPAREGGRLHRARPAPRDVAEGGKRAALVELCAGLARQGEKVLVFGHDVEALRELQGGIAGAGLEALLYDDAPSIEARDRLVARFRDPEGPMILLSGESGGEGRNFQFAHHLFCADLPESPLVLEQRIGRLDRLGQQRPVEIHLVVEPGEEAFLADLYEKEIGDLRRAGRRPRRGARLAPGGAGRAPPQADASGRATRSARSWRRASPRPAGRSTRATRSSTSAPPRSPSSRGSSAAGSSGSARSRRRRSTRRARRPPARRSPRRSSRSPACSRRSWRTWSRRSGGGSGWRSTPIRTSTRSRSPSPSAPA